MIYYDLFSGIGGFHLGLTQAGFKFKKVYYSEINKYAMQIYKKRFREAKYIGSVETISGQRLEKPDIITFGSPCQDFSISGKRAGLDGDRSSLIQYAIDLINQKRPDIFIWENVKGAFSSNAGEDFWAIIKAFADLGGYRLEWQLLNTAWFLPQNRERIYLVGYNPERCSGKIFPIGETDSNIKKSGSEFKDGIRVQAIDSNYGKGADGKRTMIGTWRTQYGEGFREVKGNVCPTIPARAREDGSGQPVIVAQRGRENGQQMEMRNDGRTNSLTSVEKDNYVMCEGIRRLTPIECERLQGFPKGWTDGISDTQRYKALGNAVSVPVVKAVGERITRKVREM